jgi:hypothetical protein
VKPLAFVLAALTWAVASGCQPQTPRIPTPFDKPSAGGPIAVDGVVLSVERPRPEDNQAFVHLVISPADSKPIRLVLAPGWYLEEKGLHFEPQQTIHANGKRVVQNGEPSIVVQTIRQGDRNYLLRDQSEAPAWTSP